MVVWTRHQTYAHPIASMSSQSDGPARRRGARLDDGAHRHRGTRSAGRRVRLRRRPADQRARRRPDRSPTRPSRTGRCGWCAVGGRRARRGRRRRAHFRGPAVHGKRGERFLYLTWGDVGPAGEFAMFRRAKLMFADIAPRSSTSRRRRGCSSSRCRSPTTTVARVRPGEAAGDQLASGLTPPGRMPFVTIEGRPSASRQPPPPSGPGTSCAASSTWSPPTAARWPRCGRR